MSKVFKYFLCLMCLTQPFFAAVVPAAKAVAKNVSTSSVATAGAIFQGITEQGIVKNTFLCEDSSVTESSISGSNVASSDCSINKIKDAIGFDVSGGKTIQFLNNFAYWTRQKSQAEQNYQINNPQASDSDVQNYMQQNGWGSIGAFCIVISTNEVLQEVIEPDKQAGSGEIKVIVQLWYSGDNLIQLWSQDVAMLNPGQTFTLALSNAADTDLSTVLQASSTLSGYISTISKTMQPDNRNTQTYAAAIDSARMVRIQVA